MERHHDWRLSVEFNHRTGRVQHLFPVDLEVVIPAILAAALLDDAAVNATLAGVLEAFRALDNNLKDKYELSAGVLVFKNDRGTDSAICGWHSEFLWKIWSALDSVAVQKRREAAKALSIYWARWKLRISRDELPDLLGSAIDHLSRGSRKDLERLLSSVIRQSDFAKSRLPSDRTLLQRVRSFRFGTR